MIKKIFFLTLSALLVTTALFAYPTEVFQGKTVTASSGTTLSNCTDGDTGTYCNQINDGDGAWLKVDLGVGVSERVNQIKLYTSDNITYSPDDFIIQGSANDSDWTTLATVSNLGMSLNTWATIDFTNTSAYRYYRLFNLHSYSESWVFLSEIQGTAVAMASRRIITT